VLTALAGCLAVLAIGARINGARRWIELGPATFQPSELAKLAVAYGRPRTCRAGPAPRTLRELWRPIGLLLGLFCLLILAEPTSAPRSRSSSSCSRCWSSPGTPGVTLASAGAIAVSLGLLAIWFEPYRRARIFSFLDPWKDPQGAGFQTVQALISLGSGGPFGVGLGQGVAKINYLPEAHTDMILGVIGEELGLVGVAAVLAAFVVFAWAGLRVALTCKDPFGKRLAVGVVALVSGQAVINLAAVLGLAP
jgi:cell division protein FtsW